MQMLKRVLKYRSTLNNMLFKMTPSIWYRCFYMNPYAASYKYRTLYIISRLLVTNNRPFVNRAGLHRQRRTVKGRVLEHVAKCRPLWQCRYFVDSLLPTSEEARSIPRERPFHKYSRWLTAGLSSRNIVIGRCSASLNAHKRSYDISGLSIDNKESRHCLYNQALL